MICLANVPELIPYSVAIYILGKKASSPLAYLKEGFCVGPVLAGGIMEERGETQLGVVGDQLLSDTLTALREGVKEKGVSFFPTRENGKGKGRSYAINQGD